MAPIHPPKRRKLTLGRSEASAQRHFEQNANGDAGKTQDRDGLADTRAAVAAQDARTGDREPRPLPPRSLPSR
jgi:hypothetical protein